MLVNPTTNRRNFIAAAAGLAAAGSVLAQRSAAPAAAIPARKGKITKLFKTPEGYPNAIAVAPEGLWVGEQKTDNACLVDWDGKLLKTLKTESKNTSGIAYGGGFVWMGANTAPNGISQIDMNGRTVANRQVPLGGGGCHGLQYSDGKLWIAALRLRGILRVDPQTWQPEYLIPYNVPRAHGLAWDNGALWLVTGSDAGAGLIKYDAATAAVLETVQFAEPYPDPHGLAIKDGVMYTCDAGIHPGWQENISPTHGYICRVDLT
jgi:streptogramin lyase